MELVKILRKLVYLAPCRCGRTFYHCDLVEKTDNIILTFTPTDDYLTIDPRREDEVFMPEHFHTYEKWQHVGLVIGSIEYFLKEKSIEYFVDERNIENYITLTIKNPNIEIDSDLSHFETFKHAHRSFNTEKEVDQETYQLLSNKIDDFLKENNGHKMMVTDWKIRKKIYALAIYWDTMGEKNGYIKAPQMNAPLIITVPPKEFDKTYIFRMGRLYSDIGLTTINKGYYFAFCNAFNYLDPRIQHIEKELGLEYGKYTINDVIPRSFMCIGTALDNTKPFNWLSMKNPYHNDILPSCILSTKEFLTIKKEVEDV
jgi:hypothetical protein